jgi:sugar-specific transcriptional regulator TrmB
MSDTSPDGRRTSGAPPEYERRRFAREPAVGALVDLGLTLREARAYLALLAHGPATAAEVADTAGLARPKIYEALKSLEQRGFCIVRGERVARFQPVDPAEALPEWARRREHERTMISRRDKRLVGDLVAQLPAPPKAIQGVDSRYMHAQVGVARTLQMFADITRRAKNRLDIIVTAPVIQDPRDWHVNEIAALERGVSVRVIYSRELVGNPNRYEPLVAHGADVRASDDLPLKMVVRDDGSEAVVALVDSSDGEHVATSVSIRHPELTGPFQLLFNRQWRQAVDLRKAPPAKRS